MYRIKKYRRYREDETTVVTVSKFVLYTMQIIHTNAKETWNFKET